MENRKRKQSKSPKDIKKRQGNVKSYYNKNRPRLHMERRGEKRSEQIYELLPKHDLDQLNYRRGFWKLDNALVDSDRYFQAIEKDVNDYFLESTEKFVDQQMLALHVIPYNHPLLPQLFTLKLVVSDKFIIPRILDYHYAYYLNEDEIVPNSKNNRIAFLDFLEYKILQELHVRTPFEYISIGNRIVGWLREKRRKVQKYWPFEEKEEKPTSVVETEEIFRTNKFEKFPDIEKAFIEKEYLKKTKEDKLQWSLGKKEFTALIYVMNDKKYFAKNIFDAGSSTLRHKVKQFFEGRYQVSLSQYLEPSRIKKFDYNSFSNTPPYNSI